MRKITSYLIFLALLALLLALPMAANAETNGTCGDYLTWVLDDEGTLTISGTGEMEHFSSAGPWGTDVKTVVISDGVTSIGKFAFRDCSSLTSVAIPDSVTSTGYGAFYTCNQLQRVHIASVKSWLEINFDSYYGNPLHSLLPSGSAGLYLNGSPLTEVVIPDGITSISDGAFNGCSSLVSITIPASVTSVGSGAFNGCSQLQEVHISSVKSWLEINFDSYYGNPLHSGNAELYMNGEPLTEVIIPDGITSICAYAFRNCGSLTSVTIPNSVTTIKDAAFANCSTLKNINIPTSVTNIGKYAFDDCSSLKSIVIPNGVQYIPEQAFRNCSNLTDIALPNSVQFIGDYAFDGCSSLTCINLPEGLMRIGKHGFSSCSNLMNVTIPSSLTQIAEDAFEGAERIQQVNIASLESWVGILFSNTHSQPLHGGNGILYVNDTPLTDAVITNGVAQISKYAFHNYKALKSVTMPDSVKNIMDYAFSDCENLTSVNLAKGLTSISDYAFQSCSNLANIDIPDSVASIGRHAFEGCSNLTSINLPDSVTQIGWNAFGNCHSLMNINLPEGLTNIESRMFVYCEALTSISIPASVTSIDFYAFNGCDNLTKVAFYGEKMPAIGRSVFSTSPTIYCYEFSEVDFWATENGYPIVYLDADDPFVGLTITLPNSLTLWNGESHTVTADVFPPIDASFLTWESSDTKVATVDQTGKVTALKRGTTVITLRCGDVLDQMLVSVRQKAEAFDLSETEIWIASKTSAQLNMQNIKPANADVAVVWNSSDTAICTVNDGGLISALRPGTTTVMATIGEVSRTCTVHVTYPVDSINLSSDALMMTVGDTHQLTATVTTRNQTLSNKLVTFSSCNSSVATVDEKGLVTALQAGTAKITATASNGVSASCTITVKPLTGTYTVKHLFATVDGTSYEEDASAEQKLTGIAEAKTEAVALIRAGFTAQAVQQQTIQADSSTIIEIRYDRNSYKLTFKLENGEADIINSIKYGTAVKAPTTLAKEGHSFAGWDKEIPATMPAEDVTVTATWTVNKYTVKFVNEDGTVLQSGEVAYGEMPAYTGETPTKAADAQYTYTFTGWTPEVVAVTGEATYTATFSNGTNSYTVTWVNESGTLIDAESVAYGGSTTKSPAVPDKLGHTGKWNHDGKNIVQNTIIKPEYTANEYTLSFDTAGGSAIAPITQKYGSAVTAPASPTKDGWTFQGWDKEIPATMPAENMTVTATWVPEVKVTSFSFSVPELWLYSAETHQLEVTEIAPEDAICEFTWTSSDPVVLSVNANGLLTASGAGTAVLTVTEKWSGLTQTCTVHVVASVTGITFADTAPQMIPGDTKQLTATVTCGDQTVTNKLVTFSSSDEKVAAVDQNGIVTAVSEGNVTITVTAANGVSASCTIKVLLLGDANGDGKVDVADVLIILQHSAGWDVTVNTAKADVTGDGVIGISDALKILQDCMGGNLVSAMRALQTMLADLGLNSLEITLQPVDQHVTAGETVAFTVTASGDRLNYQWYINRNDGADWKLIPGATSSTYTIENVSITDDGCRYYCAVTSADGMQTISNEAALHVTPAVELPMTGDAANPMAWLALMAASLAGIMLLTAYSRKRLTSNIQ